MRVQGIGQNYQQNYRNQNGLSFQAEGVFVKKCLDDSTIKNVYEAGQKLEKQLNANKIPSTMVGINSGNFAPFVSIIVGTDAKYDHTVIPMLENFAKELHLESDIKPGFNANWETLVTRAKDLIAKLKVD